MHTVGGTIAVTAGIFGTIAAVLTLGVGLASALQAEEAARIRWSEWGAVVASFATVILGAICLHARSALAGLFLMMASLCGAVFGGMVVAVFMALVFAGGAVASIGMIADDVSVAPAHSGTSVAPEAPPFGSPDALQISD